MTVIGLDPGTTESAFVIFDGERITDMQIFENQGMLGHLKGFKSMSATLVIEQFESFGMAVGREVFQTVFWSGRFAQGYAHGLNFAQMPRRTVKLHLCGVTRATDANVRQALLDRFGGKEQAVGTKKQPGPLYGVKSHLWSALAIAVTYHDQHAGKPAEIRPGVVPMFDDPPRKKAGTSADF